MARARVTPPSKLAALDADEPADFDPVALEGCEPPELTPERPAALARSGSPGPPTG